MDGAGSPKSAKSKAPAVTFISQRNGRKVYQVDKNTFEVSERYDIRSVIGSGSYGVVCKGVDTKTGKPVAVKKVERVFEDLIDARRIWREAMSLRLLAKAGARNIMHLIEITSPMDDPMHFQDLYFISNFYKQDLEAVMPTFDIEKLPLLAADLLASLSDIHACGFIHRDIKPQNVLIDEAGRAFLCDFGLCRGGMDKCYGKDQSCRMTDHVVTRWYRAPEILLLNRYGPALDVWGIGCVLAEVVLRRPCFPGKDFLDQMRLLCAALPTPSLDFIDDPQGREFVKEVCTAVRPQGSPAGHHHHHPHHHGTGENYAPGTLRAKLSPLIAPEAVEFILALLAFDPTQRLTASQALQHPWLVQYVKVSPSKLQPPTGIDWSLDIGNEVRERRLRRALWQEVTPPASS